MDSPRIEARPTPHPGKFDHAKTFRKVHYAKKHQRTDIRPDNWGKFGYWQTNVMDLIGKGTFEETIPRVHIKDTSVREFIEKYEKPGLPVIIQGLMDDWPAMQNWEWSRLERKYRHGSFKVGEDDDGHRIKMRLKYFLDYLRHQTDDSPLYLFESACEDATRTAGLLEDFRIPDVFPFDLHCVLGLDDRPPHRWFLIGPKRSGTTVHRDPIGTAAWNALQSGEKRWCLFPPDLPKEIVKAKGLRREGEDDEAIDWFAKLLPRLKRREGPGKLRILEGTQGPGEIIFVPPRWWHAVVNLSDTVACTQNFVSLANFDLAWKEMRRGRKKLAVRWLNRLDTFFPELAHRARQLNRADNWRMHNEPRRAGGDHSSSDSSSSSSSSSEASTEMSADLEDIEEELMGLESRWPADLKEAVEARRNEAVGSDGAAKASRSRRRRHKVPQNGEQRGGGGDVTMTPVEGHVGGQGGGTQSEEAPVGAVGNGHGVNMPQAPAAFEISGSGGSSSSSSLQTAGGGVCGPSRMGRRSSGRRAGAGGGGGGQPLSAV
uniref:JmjC domain-containing protein n=1 Tax=Chromera velia CCMP2878 TaxID=1169474 RepID=A0A0G4I6S4_9ALVE|eukprot:Cvel_1913.t1-p1 / transcript=Cvel_1913.t1 / gene=Cvel_1913 / organism=Chromera_velia_CCMP2878 / gene_product=Bifunctional arginine demethylase and, putative / transcript_product=Bifunctional arginine demethylase and, putative / location=Cvel_scaffold71:136269-140474(-) / protein_length=543 / sequence_SO=supercontig / SO=protein_coding / is_pseudo=false